MDNIYNSESKIIFCCIVRIRTRHTGNSINFKKIRALKNTESVTVGPRSGANSQFCTYINHRVKIKYIQ